jgi:putative acetyltransferase
MSVTVRPLLHHDARTFLEVHHAAVREIALSDYPAEIIEAWAPLPITEAQIARFLANPDGEIRVAAVNSDEILGIGAVVLDRHELRACYVAPRAARRGVGAQIVREIEQIARADRVESLWLDSSLTAELFYSRLGYIATERGVHKLGSGQVMACVKMRKNLSVGLTSKRLG